MQLFYDENKLKSRKSDFIELFWAVSSVGRPSKALSGPKIRPKTGDLGTRSVGYSDGATAQGIKVE